MPAQLETALAWGVDVTHLDTHMNVVQGRTDLYEIYLDLAEEFGSRSLPPFFALILGIVGLLSCEANRPTAVFSSDERNGEPFAD